MNKHRIRFQLMNGQWTYWLSKEDVKHYCTGDRAKEIKSVIIEKTMPYDQAIEYLKDFGK
jgi:hypothetical protein